MYMGVDLARDNGRRREIELNIELHRNAAAGNLLEVGRWLNAAKDEGVVPHGEWTDWVAEHAALGERTAQLWMQAARELPAGSSLAALGTAKLRSLMALPAGEREAFAEKIGADRLTSREVDAQVKAARAERDAQVKAARAERDEALRLVGEQKKRLAEMDREKTSAVLDAVNRTRKETADAKQAEIDRLNGLIESGNIGKRRTDRLYGEALERVEALRRETEQLRAELDAARAKGDAPSAAQQEEIAQLRAAIRKRDAELDRLSEALDEAQTAAMRGSMTGEGERTSPVTLILSAIGALMTQAGRAPAELARMQGIDEETRQLVAGQARMAGQWAMQVLSACGEGDAHV